MRDHRRSGRAGRRVTIARAIGLGTLAQLVLVAAPAVRAVDPPAGAVIWTVAGGGDGDGGPAIGATFATPVRAVATERGLVIADTGAQRVRRVDERGVIHALLGTGIAGFSGDGGPSALAASSGAAGAAADAQGRIYIADAENDRIRRIDANGVVTTIAGGVDDDAPLGDGGPATKALLKSPSDVAVGPDGVTIYIADSGNARVRRIDRAGTITTVFGGGDDAPTPSAVAVARDGTLYVADGGHQVRSVSPSGVAKVIAGDGEAGYEGDGGPATAAKLSEPRGLAVDASGRVLIAERGNNRIRRIAKGVITTVAGGDAAGFAGDGGPASAAKLSGPTGVSVDPAGTIYVADAGNNRVRRIGGDGKISTVAGRGTGASGDSGPASAAGLGAPTAVAIDATGTTYIADAAHHVVRAVAPTGRISTIAGNGAVTCPADAAPDAVCPGSYAGDGGQATLANLNAPAGVAVDATGNVYIADTANNVIRKRAADGTISTIAGNRANGADGKCPEAAARAAAAEGKAATTACLFEPTGLALDGTGNLLVADTGNNRICKIDAAGLITTVAGSAVFDALPQQPPPVDGAPATPGTLVRLTGPRGVAATATDIFVADTAANRVLKIDATGAAVVAGTGTAGNTGDGAAATAATLSAPTGLAVDATGVLYISDTGNNVIRRVAADGVISAFAGGGAATAAPYAGDGGAPTQASLVTPVGVALGPESRLYVADSGRSRVRVVGTPPTAATVNLSASPNSVSPGTEIVVTGTATRAGTPLKDVVVRVLEREFGGGETQIGLLTTDAAGAFRVTAKPVRRSDYVATIDPSATLARSTSSPATVRVKFVPTVTAPTAGTVTIRAGSSLTVRGATSPATPQVRVELVSVSGGRTTVLAAGKTGSDGRFAITKAFARGSYTVSVRVPAAAGNETGSSRSWVVKAT